MISEMRAENLGSKFPGIFQTFTFAEMRPDYTA